MGKRSRGNLPGVALCSIKSKILDIKSYKWRYAGRRIVLRSGYFQLTGNSEKTLKWLFPVNWK